jgi:hypothetical protein
VLDSHEKELEQVHLIFGFPAVSAVDDRRHALYLLNQILGGGMSSRLYQRIREREGNCYSIYSFPSLFRQQGIFAVYCATSLPFVDKVLTGIREELLKILAEGIDETELHFAKQQMRGNIMLGRESIEGRMNRLAVQELVFGARRPFRSCSKKSTASVSVISGKRPPPPWQSAIRAHYHRRQEASGTGRKILCRRGSPWMNALPYNCSPAGPASRRETVHAAGYDLAACLDAPLVLAPGQRLLVPTGIALEIPRGWRRRYGRAAVWRSAPA